MGRKMSRSKEIPQFANHRTSMRKAGRVKSISKNPWKRERILHFIFLDVAGIFDSPICSDICKTTRGRRPFAHPFEGKANSA